MEFDPSNPLKVRRRDDDDSDVEPEVPDISNNKKRKKAINTQQYDDDSSNDEQDSDVEDVNDESIEDKKKVNSESKNEDGDDSDMFGSDDEEEKVELQKPKKGIKLMDIDQFHNELDGHGAASKLASSISDDEEEDEDDENAPNDYYLDQETIHSSKPRKEPKLDSFSLKEETSTGVFDADGNYYENQVSDDEDWQSLKKKEIKKAKLAQETQKLKSEKKKKERSSKDVGELLKSLIGLLQPVESPMEAMHRLNKSKVKKSKKVTMTDEIMQKEKQRQQDVTDITESCESLIDLGFKDVYDLEREELMLKYKEETGEAFVKVRKEVHISAEGEHTGVAKSDDTEERKEWHFRWVGDSVIHGPYSTREMAYWKMNHFQNRVEVRKSGQEHFDPVSAVEFV